MFGLGGWDFLVGEASRGSSSKAETDVGGRAPDFVLQDLSGNSLRLSDLRGSVVILNF
jgi:cytochrome oxidase Cu insertion factor (SCO1/SenC/PrrC family)